MRWYQFLGFTLYLAAIIYLFNCLLSRTVRRVDLRLMALYVSAMACFGVFGEVFVGSVYHALFDKLLWQYLVAPVHQGYTSLYAPVVCWGILGFHVYLLHDYLRAHNIERVLHLALFFAAEAILVELFVNGSFRLFFGSYLFYYLPGDLWHLASVQTLPFYAVAGFAFVEAIQRFKRSAWFFTTLSLYSILVFVFLAR